MLSSLSFLFPWLLGALAIVPALWWLLRVTPPRPQVVRFPAFFLLRDLQVASKAPARTPWWLLLLRCLLVILFILALAEPISRLQSAIPGDAQSPVLLVVDNGWSAAVNWDKRLSRIKGMLAPLQRSDRNVYIVPTAAAPDAAEPALLGPMTAAAAQQTVAGLLPQAWPASHGSVAKAIRALPVDQRPGYAVFFSDGSSRSAMDTQEMITALTENGAVTEVVSDDTVNRPVLLRRVDETPGQLAFEVELLTPRQQQTSMMLVATSDSGALIDELRFAVAAGDKTTRIDWLMEEGLREKVARIALRDPQMASTVYLTDAQWRQRPVGVIADSGQRDNASFLNEVYYLKRALEGDSTLVMDSVEALMEQQRAVMVWPDSAPLTAPERAKLLEWVEQGGFLIRFAGPTLAANPDDVLLPVSLRAGQRAMEGALTWEKPVVLGAIAETSPFYGLDVPPDVTVSRQVLASPDPETFERTWLQLADGTPLITGGAVGKGSIALIHTTAGPDWSNFCYSGLYVDALRRMVALSRGISDYRAALTLAPLQVMDGYGRLQPPASGSIAGVIDTKADYEPSSRTPPGIYGDSQQFQVYTLGQHLSGLYPLPSLSQNITRSTYAAQGEENYKPLLLKLALLLLVVDFVATLILRGFIVLPAFTRWRKTAAVMALLAVMLASAPAQAQDMPDDAARASNIYLAYVETGDQSVDQLSRNGLESLARVLTSRTSIRVRGVVGVDPEIDTLYTYPFLYWPMTSAQRPLSLSAAQEVQNYMTRGGTVVFDTRDLQFGDIDGQTVGVERLRALTQSLQVPALMQVEKGHILTKSFYLLDNFPGLYAGGKLWVEKDPNPNYDSITSVVIGGNDWAAAWSDDSGDRARLPVQPGGDRQREMALRFGVNLVMVTLTGNYKADQVHVPFILQRLGQ